jgi:mannose-P-dolichol utilization defect protein 1
MNLSLLLPPWASDFLKQLIGGKCFSQIFERFDVFQPADHHACNKLFLSKAIGMGIVVSSGLVKIPQIMKIVSAGNATGIAFITCFTPIILWSFVTILYPNDGISAQHGEVNFNSRDNFE